jgi:cytochrome c peroxidase
MRWLFCLTALLTACGGSRDEARPAGAPVALKAPLGLPPVPVPDDNPPTVATVEFGRRLFFSPVLSVDRSLSCATCHNPKTSFADSKSVSTGVHGKRGTRNTPTVLNAVYYKMQFWDGRARDLEAQASGPMMNSLEMGSTREGLEKAVAEDAELRTLSERAFGPGRPTMERITKGLAAFERTLVSGNSPFDRFVYGGDKTAMTEAAQRGWRVFKDPDKGHCAVCHTIGTQYALFTDNAFHNIGAGLDAEGEIPDLGRYVQTKRDADKGAFRTPSLRNVALTPPYMHDGSVKTLKDVVDFYVGGGSSNPHLDPLIRPLSHLTRQEREDLVAFLESLTGEIPRLP